MGESESCISSKFSGDTDVVWEHCQGYFFYRINLRHKSFHPQTARERDITVVVFLVCSIQCIGTLQVIILFGFHNNSMNSELLLLIYSDQTKAWEQRLMFAIYTQDTIKGIRIYLMSNTLMNSK